MKRIVALALLLVLVFNWYGYRLLCLYLEERSERKLESKLDLEDYSESQLEKITIPLTMLSYYNVSRTFERVRGRLEIDGVVYSFVKRRLYNDSLELLCIANRTMTQLKKLKIECYKMANDLQLGGQNKKGGSHAKSFRSFSPDCCTVFEGLHFKDLILFCSPRLGFSSVFISSGFCPRIEYPPKNC
jgi:hypothetical protein